MARDAASVAASVAGFRPELRAFAPAIVSIAAEAIPGLSRARRMYTSRNMGTGIGMVRIRTSIARAAPLALVFALSACAREPAPATHREPADATPTASAAFPEDASRPRAPAPPPTPRKASRAPGPAEARVQQDALLEAYRCRTVQCESENLGASSAAEAAWLKSRGFPTPEREAELERMSMNELESASGDDPAAQAMLGRRMMEQGEEVQGMARIAQVAADGNVYADYQLSLGYRKINPLDSAAYLRRAYLQGDAKAAMIMYMTFPRFGPVEWNAIDDRAMLLYDALLRMRAGRGRMSYGPRPRGH
jgi:hypothetical protein